MVEGPEGCGRPQQGGNAGLGSPGVVGSGGTPVSQGFGSICWNMQKWDKHPREDSGNRGYLCS